MEEIESPTGPWTVFSPEETREQFLPLRDRIFAAEGGVGSSGSRLFRSDSWMKVIIRGGVYYSDRTDPELDMLESVEDWVFQDPRDELQPLFDLLIEDGIREIVHMPPFVWADHHQAVITRPTGPAVRGWFDDVAPGLPLPERLLFDRGGRWGMFGSDEMFGLLGGEPAFMERFIERSGGMAHIRQKADAYWQYEIDSGGYEAKEVPDFYRVAGWENPPRKRDEDSA